MVPVPPPSVRAADTVPKESGGRTLTVFQFVELRPRRKSERYDDPRIVEGCWTRQISTVKDFPGGWVILSRLKGGWLKQETKEAPEQLTGAAGCL
jgi:hypothetical protein